MNDRAQVLEATGIGIDLDWERRDREIGEISGRYREVKELADGFAFRYPGGPSWTGKVRAVRDHLARHYPFFTSVIDVEPNDGPVWLRITGPDGAKEILQRGLDHAAGKATKDGTEVPTLRERVFDLGFRLATARARVLPNFLIIGAAKAGTTSLYSYLAGHPAVVPAFRKELYFFDMHWQRGASYYRAHFPTVLAKWRVERRRLPFVTGEATPCYLFHPHAPRRVLELLPRVKLIVLLRNPVDRAYSFYCMNARRGLEQLSFEEAIDREEERLAGELDKMLKDESYFSVVRHHCSYLARGIYVEQLRNWMRWFPREQFLILTNEELDAQRQATLARAQQFLGLPVLELHDAERRNYIPYPRLNETTRRRLVEHFRPHNERLFDYLGVRWDWDR